MPKKEHNDICVGIDLGTTNSLVATCRVVNGKLQTPVRKVQRYVDVGSGKARENRELLPSFVFYNELKNGDYEVFVGDFAKKQYATRPYLVAKSIKSQMGKPTVEGLQSSIPDKTPEAVSARILNHLIKDLEDFYQEKITDAVITIPANFDPVKREATLRAAELAGIQVRNEQGEYNDDEILLSEPEAVMYDLINQIQNGEYDVIIDFSTKKRVLVFDIGGGTLDITVHEVERSAESQNVYSISTIAANRYSSVAGDTFDSMIANEMYKRYIQYYKRQSPDIARRIENDPLVIPNLVNYAEELKLKISDEYFDFKQRGRTLPNDREYEYGGFMTNGYAFDDVMTKEEFEQCVEPLLGNRYTYADYKRIDAIEDDRNIIHPILDALAKAARKLAKEDIRMDAVVLSGGMSRLYLLKDRLDIFFGLNTIMVSDPDKAVAQGAAVYHYYLHQESSLMHKLHEQEREKGIVFDQSAIQPQGKSLLTASSIVSDSHVLTESIYLGLKGGATHELASDGERLPYASEIITGFKIEKGQHKIRIPIMQKTNKPGQFEMIASGDIIFKKSYHEDTAVSIKFSLSRNQIMSFEAWTSHDAEGTSFIEKGQATLAFGSIETQKSRTRMLPPPGVSLIPQNELSSIKTLCGQIDTIYKTKRDVKRLPNITSKIKMKKDGILYCRNPEDFAVHMLSMLEEYALRSVNLCLHLIPTARKLSNHWSDADRRKLVKICQDLLNKERNSFYDTEKSIWTSVYIEAIKTIGYCGYVDQTKKLAYFSQKRKYISALLYAYSYSRINADWIFQQFLDMQKASETLWALGFVMKRDRIVENAPDEQEVVKAIIDRIMSGTLIHVELTAAVVSLGLICDQRKGAVNPVSAELVKTVRDAINMLSQYYTESVSYKVYSIATQLLDGTALDESDEKYLLSFLEIE